ncbi:hypothetical protein BGZ81_009048 [Podila clonocystis]|nr:hypothetical protein BGZ81_009048 [Podila clonocystis]
MNDPHTCELNYHAPHTLVHPYFGIHGHKSWSFLLFAGFLAKESDKIVNLSSVLKQWEATLGELEEQLFVPNIAKKHIKSLLSEIKLINVARLSRKRTNIQGKQHSLSLRPPSQQIANIPVKRKLLAPVQWFDFTDGEDIYVNTFRLQRENLLPANALRILRNFKLRFPEEPELVWALTAFKQATSWRCLQDLEEQFTAHMRLREIHNQTQENHNYICKMVGQAAEMWQRNELAQWRLNKEGWYLVRLHGPLMEIFYAIPYLAFSATDLKGRNNSNGDKHDAIMRHQSYPLDIVVMEAKFHKQETPMLIDCLAITLLEARFLDGTPVIYQVRRFEVPDGPLSCARFVEGLGFMISFKDRIQDFLKDLQEAIANAPPDSPSSGSSGASTDEDNDFDYDDDYYDNDDDESNQDEMF